jgi:hypothetical protein
MNMAKTFLKQNKPRQTNWFLCPLAAADERLQALFGTGRPASD